MRTLYRNVRGANNDYVARRFRSVCRNTVKRFFGTDEELAIADSWASAKVAVVRQFVERDLFELRCGLQHIGSFVATYGVDLVADQDDRCVESAANSFTANLFSSLGVDTRSDSAVVDPVQVPLVENRRRHVRSTGFGPDNIAVGRVILTSEANCRTTSTPPAGLTQTMLLNGLERVAQGVTTMDEVLRVTGGREDT